MWFYPHQVRYLQSFQVRKILNYLTLKLLICFNNFPLDFINNYDTSKTSASNSWSSYLGDIQIVSVADTASETPD